jgi:hypothetical protein
MEGVSGPDAAAAVAAEALRAVNHLTIGSPSSGVPGWEGVGDLYRVLAEVRVLTDRLPQVLGQLARHLERPAGLGAYKADAGTSESPERLVAAAVLALEGAQHHVAEAGSHLNAAHTAVAHLYT